MRVFSIYDVVRLKGPTGAPLEEALTFLNSAAFLDFARVLTGAEDIAFAGAMATRYRNGRFLSLHDDNAPGQGRRAAYVLNLTPSWRTDWGGHLLFHDQNGHITGGFMPAFNTLNIFTVPALHSVSLVAPYAGGPRYAITGWLRAGENRGPLSGKV